MSSSGNATGEVEFLACGADVDPAPTPRSLSVGRTTTLQHRGKVNEKFLAKLAAASAAVNFVRVPPLNCAIPCCGCCGRRLGEEDQEGHLSIVRSRNFARTGLLAKSRGNPMFVRFWPCLWGTERVCMILDDAAA